MSDIILLTLNVNDSLSVMSARQRARQIAALLQFDVPAQTKIATVVSELSRNAYLYAGGGKIDYCISQDLPVRTFKIKITDKGPGITELNKILEDKITSKQKGLGILGSKKIMDKFSIYSSEKGTEIIVEMVLFPNVPVITSAVLAKISQELVMHRPSSASDEAEQQNQELLKAYALLSKAHEDLEERVKERTEELATANTELQNEIKERKNMEEWLQRHQQKLAYAERTSSMGEMASALAHELNQPLAAIATSAQGLIRYLQDEEYEKKRLLNIIELVAKEAQRAGQVIHRMKNFARQGEVTKEKASINEIIKETMLLMQHEIKKHQVSIRLELNEFLPNMYIDSIQIQQALMNIIRNAIQSMKSGHTSHPLITIQNDLIEKHQIKITIIDNGPGFRVENPQQLFEPHFTTKKKGMGIGLSITRTIIQAHGGNLSAYLQPEGGACFQFILPINGEQTI